MSVTNNIINIHEDQDNYALVSILYKHNIHTIKWDKFFNEASIWISDTKSKELNQDDMNNIADICYEFFS